MARKTKSLVTEKLLTDAELELMSILWALGEGTVAEVMAGLPPGKDLAYTSVSTILRILEQKEILEARKEGRGHVYVPVLEKQDYEARALKHVMSRVFDGTPASLVRQLLSSVPMTNKQLDEIRKLIDQAGGKK